MTRCPSCYEPTPCLRCVEVEEPWAMPSWAVWAIWFAVLPALFGFLTFLDNIQ